MKHIHWYGIERLRKINAGKHFVQQRPKYNYFTEPNGEVWKDLNENGHLYVYACRCGTEKEVWIPHPQLWAFG